MSEYILRGTWKIGWALDVHTLASYIHFDRIETKEQLLVKLYFSLSIEMIERKSHF